MSINKKLYTTMNEHPESQRTKVEAEEILIQELFQLCKTAYERNLTSGYGQTSPDYKKPWVIQINGRDEYFTLEEAKLKLEEMLNGKDSD